MSLLHTHFCINIRETTERTKLKSYIITHHLSLLFLCQHIFHVEEIMAAFLFMDCLLQYSAFGNFHTVFSHKTHLPRSISNLKILGFMSEANQSISLPMLLDLFLSRFKYLQASPSFGKYQLQYHDFKTQFTLPFQIILHGCFSNLFSSGQTKFVPVNVHLF